jgi:hypothetical protein
MTKSKGVGRGGVRSGAGRRPRVSTVDWDAVGRAYYTGKETLDVICGKFGIGYGDLLAHAASSHWMQRRPTRSHPDDLGDLAGALALEMFGNDDSGMKVRQRFVAAMVALNAREGDIAEILRMDNDMPGFKQQFAKQLSGTRW